MLKQNSSNWRFALLQTSDHPCPLAIRDVPGADGYGVDSSGGVWSKWRGAGPFPAKISDRWKRIVGWVAVRGYHMVHVKFGSDGCQFGVHRLVAMAFIGPCPDEMEVCHDNGIKTDNRLENLRYDTRSSNMIDRERHGTGTRGSHNKQSRLTESQVKEIKIAIRRGARTGVLADQYGVSPSTICGIKYSRGWAHLVA